MTTLGELELRIMQVLWATAGPVPVRAVHEHLVAERDLAYTTVMTVLDRLAKKQVVDRSLNGRAWEYVPLTTRAELVGNEMVEVLREGADGDVAPSLAAFVGALNEDERAELLASLGNR